MTLKRPKKKGGPKKKVGNAKLPAPAVHRYSDEEDVDWARGTDHGLENLPIFRLIKPLEDQGNVALLQTPRDLCG